MSLFRKFFYRKPPDGLLEISERIYVFDCCFSTDVLEEDDYKVYMEGILGQLRDQFSDASFMVFNFREGEKQGQISDILAEYDMTVMDYPRHYEGCPLLMMEVIHHFLKSCGNWLSLGPHNLLLLHCERGGWPVLAFMLAGLLIYRKQYSGEKRTLDMIYKQAPCELLPLLSPLNSVPSQLRYLQYISRRNVGSAWPPLDRALTLDCVILRTIPNFNVEGGCRPICRIYGQDPLMAADRTPIVLFSTPKKRKTVRLYKQLDCDLVKIDIHCHIQGDVVLECINLDEDLEHEKMMFRVMFNTAFIRSNILMLNRDSIDILWDAKDRFSKDFRAEVLLSEMDSAASLITTDVAGWEGKEGLPMDSAPPPPLKKPALTACLPPPPPPPLRSGPAPGPGAPCLVPPPPPPPHSASKPPGGPAVENTPPAPPMPPPLGGHISLPHGLSKGTGADPQSLPLVGKGGMGLPLGIRGRVLTRSTSSRNPLSANSTSKKVSLKPLHLHWVKVTRAMQGSLWAEPQKVDEASKAPEFDMSELESLFSVMVPKSDLRGVSGKSSRRESLGSKSDKVNLIDARRAYNCEIMLTKIKMPLPDLRDALLALDDSVLDADQVENLIKFCPTKEEIELLKGYNGDKENLGKCEQFILELMIVPRVESKLRVFSFKIQFCSQVSYLSYSLNIVNSAAEEIRKSANLRSILQTVLSLRNALNRGTARGSAIGFKLDSLLKLADTRAGNNKMTLMHYLCKVLAEHLPELLDFHKDFVSLEAASKIQLKYLAEEMQAISKGLEKVEEELTASENDGPVSQHFRKTLKEFLVVAEAEGRSLASLYSGVGRNADALATYFGEDPARFPFEQVVSTLLNFIKMFVRAHEENCKQLELKKKRAQKEAEVEKMKISSPKMDTKHPLRQDVNCKL